MRVLMVAIALVTLLALPAMAEHAPQPRSSASSIPVASTATRDKNTGDDHGEEVYESASDSNTDASRSNGTRTNINRKNHN